MNRYWYLPLTGLAFIVLLIVGFIVGGEPPTADESSVEEIVAFYADNEGSVMASVVLVGFAAVFLIVFTAYLRSVLTAAAGGRDILATSALIGATLVVVGLTIDGSILAGLAQVADDIDPTAVQALQALWDNNFVPYAIGVTLFFLSIGFLLIRDRALPAWLGWVAIVLVALQWVGGIADIEVVFVPSFIGMALWLIVASIMLTVRERRGTGSGTAPPAAAPPA